METMIESKPSPMIYAGLERRVFNEWIKGVIKSAHSYSEEKLNYTILLIERENIDGKYRETVRILKALLKQRVEEKLVWKIKTCVCNKLKVDIDLIENKTRKREVVQARQIIQVIVKYQLNWSLAKVGLNIGLKDHATIMHSIKTMRNLYETNKYYRENVDSILIYLGAENIKKWLL